MDPFEPTPQLRREYGVRAYTPDADRFGQHSRDERDLARMRARAEEVRGSHWVVHTCPAGHVTETHRMTGGETAILRCPVCGRESVKEEADQTAIREHLDWMAPAKVISRAFDMLSEWAVDRLNSQSWTARSDMQREAALKQNAIQRPGGQDDPALSDPRLFQNPFTRKR